MIIDWECARYTKPDKPLNAYDTLYKIYPELEEKISHMNADAREYKTVLPEHIAAVVSKWTGVPADRLNAEEQSKLLNIEDELRKRVVGQDHALSVFYLNSLLMRNLLLFNSRFI